MNSIGFTGTQTHLTCQQHTALQVALERAIFAGGENFHHGDCKGADAAAAKIAKELGLHVVGHPPDNPQKRAFFKSDDTWPEKPYRDRNADIVGCADWLIACPRGAEAKLPYSGTWMTVRMARKLKRPILIIWPDGRKEWENAG